MVKAKKWGKVRTFLSPSNKSGSLAPTEISHPKKNMKNLAYTGRHGIPTFIFLVKLDAPLDIIRAILDAVGGKKLLMQNNSSNMTCLQCSCEYGIAVEKIRMLVDYGGIELILSKDSHNRTCLHTASMYGVSVETVQLLVDLGGRELLFTKYDFGTCLHYACLLGASIDIIRLLVTNAGGGKELLMSKNTIGALPAQAPDSAYDAWTV
jgi:hypothetical protein